MDTHLKNLLMISTLEKGVDHLILDDAALQNFRASKNKDLFWAIRGGGGNFGVITG